MKWKSVFELCLLSYLAVLSAAAQETDQIEQLKKQLQQLQSNFQTVQEQQRQQIESLQKRIEAMQRQQQVAATNQPGSSPVPSASSA
ncbi:MAG TPA: hypothetical protein VFF11_09580, partial [Candidatus Binatia bacterium]|nr:hypothetical protein [Candidatus Binatia bacterium]